jgi:predicted nucleotidyltransferase
VLRPLLAARWIVRTQGPAPIEFERLLVNLTEHPEVLEQVRVLLEQKRRSPELGLAPAVPVLNAFIEAELEIGKVPAPPKPDGRDIIDNLNRLLHDVLDEAAVR